ncbi:MAG: YraN family protein [Patescibacteria group bacterium]
MPDRPDLGILGEDLAVKFLKKNGYKILQRNFRSKFGEIDIIAQDPSAGSGQVLVFVEVKTRWSKSFGPPEEAITPWKIRRIIKAGEYYKMLHPELPEALRLDAVCLDLSPTGRVGKIKIIKNITG